MKKFSRHHLVSENALTNPISFKQKRWSFFNFMVMATLIMFFGTTVLTGCNGGSGGGSTTAAATDTSGGDSSDTGTDVNAYTGSAKISGTVKLSELSGSDSRLVDDAGTSPRRTSFRSSMQKSVDTENEAVKLYVIGSNGDLEDTGITCTLAEDVNGDRSFECDGVKDGVNYIVRYVQLTGDGQALELKSSTYIPEGEEAPAEEPDVSPQTSVVAETLVDAILSATAGSDIDDSLVNAIIESVKTTIETLVETGTIQIPSMVVEVEEDDNLSDILGEETVNEKLDNTSGIILADEGIDNEIGFIAAETKADKYDMSVIDTDEEKAAFIRLVFQEMLTDEKGESDDMPEFFFDFFTWLYINNNTITTEDLLGTLISSMEYGPGAVNTDQVSVQGVLDMFNNEIQYIHSLTAKDPATLTALEKEDLADIPPVIRGLFPADFGVATASTLVNTPQSIALVVFLDEVYMPETVEPDSSNMTGTADDSGKINYDEEDVYEWSDEALFQILDMPAYVAANPGKFNGIEIFGLYLHPGTVWIEGDGTTPGEQREALMGGTDFMNLAGFASDSVDEEISGDSGAAVTLTYPKASGGTGTIDLVYLTYHGDDEGNWGIDPWREAEMLNTSDTDRSVMINPDRVISDFTSGTYTVTIVHNGTTTSKSFEKKVITGMTNKYAKLISPQGMPNWPGNNASQDEMEAFDAAWEAFYINGGRTNFTANVDENGEPATGDAATKAKITVTWEAPDVELPDGVKMVYNLDIGQGGCDDTGCSWDPIWNSWEANKRIYTTSFIIPHTFDIQTVEEAQSNPFHLNIGVSFIDQATGEQLGTGGHAHTEFTVGEAIDPTASFTIRGLNAINISDETIAAAGLRAALIKETHDGSTFAQTVVKIADIIGETGYTLELQIQDFINNSTTMNSWYNIILVEDASDELQAGDNLGMIPMYWPDYSSGGMWFDTWGGVLKIGKDSCTTTGDCVHEEFIVTGGEVVDGPKFYIGQDNYVPPSPDTVDAVAPEILAQTFTITGTVDTTDIEGPKVVLIEEGYDSATDMYLQSVKRIATIDGTAYSINTQISDFFDDSGKPTDHWYQIILVSDPEETVIVGKPLGYLPMWWPDWANGGFGFDTWRGGELVVFTDTMNQDMSWTHTEVVNPDDSTPVTGPSLSKIDYGAVDDTDTTVQ